MIHAKRSLTSGLINHFFSGLAFQGILFSFHHILSLSFSLFSSPSLPPSALLVICWHSGMPHHPYHSTLLICSLICLDGKRKMKMEVSKVWREKKREDEGVGKGTKKNCIAVNQVWWNLFVSRLTVREFLITHWALSECGDTFTLMPHATLPGANQHSDKNNIFHSLWWQSPHTPAVKHLQGSEIAAFRQGSHDRCRVDGDVCYSLLYFMAQLAIPRDVLFIMLTERDLLCIILAVLKDKTGDCFQEIKHGE